MKLAIAILVTPLLAECASAQVQVIGQARYPTPQITPSVQPGQPQPHWNDPVRINEMLRALVSIQGKIEKRGFEPNPPSENNPQLLVSTEHGHGFIKSVSLKESGSVVIDLLGYSGQQPVSAPDQSPAKHHQAPQQAPQQAPAKAATLAQCGPGGCGAGRAVSSRPVARAAVRPLRPLGRLFGRRG